jgi:AcrR family transcriptional regulator
VADLTMTDIIHAAVRRDLARMEAALRAFRAEDSARAKALDRAWRTLRNQLSHHVDEVAHEAIEESVRTATVAIAVLASDPCADHAAAAVEAVTVAAEVTDRHLDDAADTEAPADIETTLDRGGPFFAGEMLAWLQDGGEPRVRQALDEQVPPTVRTIYSRVFGRSYHREVAPTWR